MTEEPPDIPLELKIPLPTPPPRARGIHSTGRFGSVLRFRCSLSDIDVIAEASRSLGLTQSEFIRSCAVAAAKIIINHTTNTKE